MKTKFAPFFLRKKGLRDEEMHGTDTNTPHFTSISKCREEKIKLKNVFKKITAQ